MVFFSWFLTIIKQWNASKENSIWRQGMVNLYPIITKQ